MAIKFIRDYKVRGSDPVESYKEGQIVEGLSEASENHFVSRGGAVKHEKRATAPAAKKPAPAAKSEGAGSPAAS